MQRTRAFRTPPWPWQQAPTIGVPRVLGLRFYDYYPLVQDPIAHATALICDANCEDVNGPDPVFGATLEKQLDALACDYVFTTPDTHPERIEWGESVRRVAIDPAVLAVAPGNELTWEVARMISPTTGIVRIETIDTWLRVNINAVQVELSAMPNTANANGSPFAMPLTLGAMTLAWEWTLVHHLHGWLGPAPLWLSAAPASQVPRGRDLLSPWTDNRYAWGSFRQRHLQYQAGQHGLVRLFCTLRAGGTPATIGSIELAGSLTGFVQQAGRRAAAVENITRRY